MIIDAMQSQRQQQQKKQRIRHILRVAYLIPFIEFICIVINVEFMSHLKLFFTNSICIN